MLLNHKIKGTQETFFEIQLPFKQIIIINENYEKKIIDQSQ